MKLSEYQRYDALGLKGLLERREITARELCEAAMRAIEALDPSLNFLSAKAFDAVDGRLAELDLTAPFAGIPFLIKDGAGMKGLPMDYGSRLAQGLECEEDSELVRRLKGTGVVILGSTNIPEWANATTTESVLHGPVRNPWNLERSSGGSSGGASCAVAAGVVPVAQSSDGAGSIRIPAHCCGVFGLVPSRGRNPTGPASYGGTFGTFRQHVTTRSVRDSAAMLDHLHGPESGAVFRIAPPRRPFLEEVGADPGRLKIAFSTASPNGERVHAECVKAVEHAVQLCRELGHEVEEAAPAYDWSSFIEAFGDNWSLDYSYSIEQVRRKTGRPVGPQTLERSTLLTLQHSQSLNAERISAALAHLFAVSRQVESFFSRWDVWMSPVALTPAPMLGVIDSNSPDLSDYRAWIERMISAFACFSPLFNISGQPVVSVPLHHSNDGLPVGVQCAARVGEEATLIRLAAQFEQARPWAGRTPPRIPE